MGILDKPIEKTAQSAQDVGDHLLDHIERDAPGLSLAIALAVGQGLSSTIAGINAQFGQIASDLQKVAEAMPASVATTVSKVLDEANGLTLSTTIVITNTLTRKPL